MPRTKDGRSTDVPLWRSRSLALLLLVLAPLVVAACGGPSPHGVASLGATTASRGGSSASGASRPATVVGELERYASCMRTHGVPGYPEPVVSGNSVTQRVGPPAGIDVDSSQYTAAAADCRGLLPEIGIRGATITPGDEVDYLKAAACMRSHGITGLPDPTFSGGHVAFHVPPTVDGNSTQFLRAEAICRRLIPAGLPYSS